MKLYKISNWAEQFENNRTRELKRMAWVPVPNKHDGDGYTALVSKKNGAALLGAWLVILQVASKCDARGTLLRDGGKPHDAESISRITRLPAEIIQEALDVCSNDLQWIEIKHISDIPQDGATIPHHPAEISQATDEEWNGMEWNGKKGGKEPPAPEIPTLEEAVAMTMTAGIPKDFCAYVYDDWSSRGGKDAGSNLVRWLPYVSKRWSREQVEWRAKTHRGNKSPNLPAQNVTWIPDATYDASKDP